MNDAASLSRAPRQSTPLVGSQTHSTATHISCRTPTTLLDPSTTKTKVASSPSRRAALEAWFLSALPQIEHIARQVARRHRIATAEVEDFLSEVKVALIQKDYAVLD